PAGRSRDPAGDRPALQRSAHASPSLDAGARARGRLVRVDAVSLGGDGWGRIRPRRGATKLVDGISAHARRSRAGRAPGPEPAGRGRSAASGARNGGRGGGGGGARGGAPGTVA